MSAIELASTYVSVGLSTEGLGKQIKQAFGQAGGQATTAFDKGFKPEKAGIGKKFGAVAKVGVGAVAAIGAAVGGLALKGGITRALNIEGAQAKLKGLGHDTKAVDQIMKNALASVKGTAFGLGSAATTAAGAVAAGIKPGQQLEKVLKSVANSASASGSTMEEMGGIYNKVASVGKAQNDVLAQVADRGIPIYAALAKELGVTSEQVFKMASKGKIDFATFEKAMTRASGTVAAEMGETIPGKIDNAKAALSRLGEAAVKGFLPAISDGISKATQVFDSLAPAAQRVGQVASEAFQKVGAFISGIDFGPVITLARRALAGISDFGNGFVAGFGGIDRIGKAFADLLPLVTGPLGIIKSALVDTFSGGVDFGALGRSLGSTLGPALSSIAGLAAKVGDALGRIATAVLPVVKDGFAKISPSVGALVSAFQPLVNAIGRVVELITPVLIPAFKFLAGVIMDSLKGAIDGITLVIRGLTDVFNGIVDFVTNIFAGNWSAAWEGVKTVVWGAIQAIAGGIWTWLNVSILGTIRGGMLKALNFFTGGWASIKGLFSTTLNWLKGIVGGTWSAIRSNTGAVWNGIKSMISGVWNGIKSTVMGVAGALSKGLSGIWGGIKSTASTLWNGIKSTITGVVGRLKGGVETAFRTMKDNISSIWDEVKTAVKNPIKFVVETVINKGLIGSFNALISKIGLKNLAIGTVALPKGFASGGWTGPGSKYQPAGIVHADEHVWTKEEMRKFPGGHKAMERMREAVRRGDYSYDLGGYANGGRVRAPFPGGSWNGGRYRSGKYHGGIDYPRAVGTPVGAPEAGTVVKAARMATSYGIHAVIRGAWDHILAHLSRLSVSAGQQVAQGQVVGAVGSTGNSTGPHLHWEVRPRGGGHGSAVNPLSVAAGAMVAPAGGVEESPIDKFKGMLKGVAAKAFSLATAATDYVAEFLKDPMGHITRAFSKAIVPSGGGGIVGQIVDAIPGKVVEALKSYLKGIIGFAGGTPSAPSGWAWVGERGPELVRFRGGERVLTHQESVRAVGSGQVTQYVTLQLPEWVRDVSDMVAFLRSPQFAAHMAGGVS